MRYAMYPNFLLGQIKAELGLSDKTYHCDCGLEIDRNLNASLNLNAYGADTLQPT